MVLSLICVAFLPLLQRTYTGQKSCTGKANFRASSLSHQQTAGKVGRVSVVYVEHLILLELDTLCSFNNGYTQEYIK